VTWRIASISQTRVRGSKVGDGSGLVLSLGGELLHQAASLLHMGLHPSDVIAGYVMAAAKVDEILEGERLLCASLRALSACSPNCPPARRSATVRDSINANQQGRYCAHREAVFRRQKVRIAGAAAPPAVSRCSLCDRCTALEWKIFSPL
jgi:hypothetical protein